MKNAYPIISGTTFLIIVIALFVVFSRNIGSGSLVLAELGIRLNVPASLSGAAIGTSTVQAVGPVAWVAVEECVLGAFYEIDKSDLEQPRTRWTQESLNAATKDSADVPQQAKEFDDFYLVFEPSQAACATERSAEKKEASLREDLWRSIKTARLAS